MKNSNTTTITTPNAEASMRRSASSPRLPSAITSSSSSSSSPSSSSSSSSRSKLKTKSCSVAVSPARRARRSHGAASAAEAEAEAQQRPKGQKVVQRVEPEQVFPQLPDELKLHVLSFLAERDMAVFGAVCRQAAAMANDNHLWKRLYSRRYDSVQPPAAPVPFPSSAPPSPSVSSRSAPPSPAPRSLYASASPSLAARFARSAPASPYAAATDADVVAVAAPSPGLTRRPMPHRLLPTAAALGGSPQVNAARRALQTDAPPRNDNRGRKDDDALDALGKLSLEAEAVVDALAADAEEEDAEAELNSCEWKGYMQYRHMVLHKRWRQEAPYAVTTARGHTGNVYCIQFDSENDLLISSSQDTTVKVWDMSATTATLNCTLKGHTGPVGSVSFLPSAHLAISGSDDKTIRVWDTARASAEASASKDGSGSSACCVKVLQTGGEDGVWALQFDAQRLVADSGDKTVGMWDTETMAPLTKFSGHTKFVECLQYDGNLLFSGAQDHDLIMWDMSTAQPLHHFKACKASVYCLQADDTKLICGSADKSIYCWDLRTRKLLWQSSVNRGWIGGVMFDCSKVISCSSDKTVRVLDVETGKATSKWQQHTNSVRALKYDENRLVTASFDQTIKVWSFP